MKKVLRISLLLMLTLLIAGNALAAAKAPQPPKGVDFAVYTYDGVSFEYPASWKESKMDDYTLLVGPTVGSFAVNANIVKEEADVTLSEYKKAIDKQYKALKAKSSSKITKINDTDVIFIDLNAEFVKGIKTHAYQYIIKSGSTFYALTLTDSKAHFSKSKALFTYIGSTFKLK